MNSSQKKNNLKRNTFPGLQTHSDKSFYVILFLPSKKKKRKKILPPR